MDFLALSPRSVLWKAFSALLLILSIYVSAYLILVEREPYYGNISNIGRALDAYLRRTGQAPQSTAPIPPDSYLPKYAIAGRRIELFFAPAHELDRLVRPWYWPGSSRRHHC